MKHFYVFIVLLLLGNFGFGQTTIDFEIAGDGYTPSTTFGSGNTDVFNRTGTPINGNNTFHWAAEDISGNPSITLDQINVTGSTSFTFAIDLSYDNASAWDSTDELLITYSIDGGTYQNLMSVQHINSDPFNNPAALDLDFDGNGDSGQELSTSTFITFTTSAITLSSNTTLDIDFQFNTLTSNGEGILIDNIIITQIGGLSNPDAFSAAAISSSQIDLTYDDNAAGDDVVIVFNTDNVFDTPTGTPTVGNDFGDDEILFIGNTSGTFNHTGLTDGTTYFYRAYSYDGTDYSSGLDAETTTPCNAIAVTSISPFQEGFEGSTVPPNCWTSYTGTNGLGTAQDWQLETTEINTGSNAAYAQYENVSGGNAEDWLVSPALDLSSLSNTELAFFSRSEFGSFTTAYTIRVSTTSQTDISSFSTEASYDETDFTTSYNQFAVDLSAYDGQTIYIAFVMSQDDGDSWYLDDIEVKEGTSKNANIIENNYDEPDNIDYLLYTATSGLDENNAIKIAEFSIQDAGNAPNDSDALATTLESLTFNIIGADNIAALAIIDETQLPFVNLSEITAVTASTTFNGLSIEAPDDLTRTFSIYATFDSTTVVDNEQVRLIITEAIANATGSTFAATNAGGALTSIDNDDNRIEITATDLIFDTNISNVAVNEILTPAPTVLAVDINVNTDLDYTETTTLTPSTTGIFSISASYVATAIAGETTFDNLSFDTVGNGYTLTASSGALNTDTSSAFDVTQPVIPNLQIVAIEDFDGSTPNWTNDIASQVFIDPSSPSEGLFIQSASSNNTNFSGNTAFARDLEGESGEPSISPYTFTFDPVTVTGLTSVNVSFDYHVFANAEIGEYEIFIDGIGQGSVEYFNDPDQSPGESGTISVAIPDGTNLVALVLTGNLNGGSDILEFDNFIITAAAPPTCNTFAGNAATGFGGVLGNGSLEVCAISGTTIDFTYTRGTDNFNDYMVIYIDTQAGGITNTANLTDTGGGSDDGRKALSGFDGSSRSTLNFPPGFEPDFAISLNNNSANLFSIVESGSHNFIQNASLSPTATNNAATYTFNIDFANVNTTPSAEGLKLLATYINPSGAFRSNEAIGRLNAFGNPGANPVGMDTYYQSNSGLQGGIAPSTAAGLWSDSASWVNGNAPLNGDEIIINNDINQDTDYSAGSIDITGSNTLTVGAGTTLAMTGAINGSGNLNIDGKLIITEGGSTNPIPTYGSGSTLEYRNIVNTYDRFNEWTDGTVLGAGVPDNVIIENASLDLTNGGQIAFLDFLIGSDLTLLTNGNLTVDANESLTLDGDLINTDGNIDLNSVSRDYSSLLINGSSIGDVIYRRHVNKFNTVANSTTGENDLISPPVTKAGQTFSEFRNNLENTDIPSGLIGGVPSFLFGPFDNDANEYINYTSANDDEVLISGVGYRTASNTPEGSPFTFKGDVETATVSVGIDIGTGSEWNLIGNPYPTYINSADFLNTNAASLDEDAIGIYGYDGSADDDWTIINFNNMNEATNIAPGQGFLVAAEGPAIIEFTTSMRRLGGGDDFIVGRMNNNDFLSLQIENTDNTYHTDFYFNNNSTLGLDPGYDAGLFNSYLPDFYIYSHLVESNNGRAMAIQSLGSTDLNNVIIPLGVHANQGEQITFSIIESSLPETIDVYLDDTVANTSTLLSNTNYVFTPNVDLSGTGRFFLRYTEEALSTIESNFDNLNIYASKATKEIVINGQLTDDSICNIYDIQGRLVSTNNLNHTTIKNRIDVSSVSTGIYIVKVESNNLEKTQKLIIE